MKQLVRTNISRPPKGETGARSLRSTGPYSTPDETRSQRKFQTLEALGTLNSHVGTRRGARVSIGIETHSQHSRKQVPLPTTAASAYKHGAENHDAYNMIHSNNTVVAAPAAAGVLVQWWAHAFLHDAPHWRVISRAAVVNRRRP